MYRYRLAFSMLGMLGLQAALTGVAIAQAAVATEPVATAVEKEAGPVDPTGTWKWDYAFNDNTSEFKLKLKWDDKNEKKLTGTYTAFDNTSAIEEVKLEKDQLSFVTKREFNGNEFVVHFQGTTKPDEINGTIKLEFDNEPREFDWNAKRAVEIDDVLGTWDLRVETANGVVEPKLTITKDGDKLRGKSISQVFGELEAKNLSLKDNELSWEITGANSGYDFEVKYKGKPRGNTIDGTNEFTVDGSAGGTMTFTGKRTPPKEEQEQPAAEAKPAAEATPAAAATDAQ
jgi:hypothetical protein